MLTGVDVSTSVTCRVSPNPELLIQRRDFEYSMFFSFFQLEVEREVVEVEVGWVGEKRPKIKQID